MISIKTKVSELLLLSLPIIAGQLGQMLIGAGDIYIASLFSTESVASIGVAGGITNPLFLFGIGLMMGVSPSLAILRGEGKDQSGMLTSIIGYAFVVGLVISFITVILNQNLELFGVEASLLPSMRAYIDVVAWSFPFAIAFQGIKEFLQSFENVFIPNLISIISVVLNLIINYVLVFGLGSYAGVGEIGLAYASLSIRIIMFVLILLYVFKPYAKKVFDLSVIKNIFKFSLPIACMFFLEVLAFCTVTVLSGKLGVVEAATNNIIMTIASISFMIPLAISSAVAVKIGNALGRKDKESIIANFKATMIVGIVYVFSSAAIYFVLPEQLMNFVSNDTAVIGLGIKLLFIVAIFQFSDGLQVILTGVLRGLEETKLPSLLVFIGYWVIGLPIGVYLTFVENQGAEGLWVGLAISLTIVFVSQALLTLRRLKQVAH